jgi:hypothetical protein
MSKSAWERKAEELARDLHNERRSNAVLKQELDRVWRLVPGGFIDLMGVYPPLRKLLHVLAEAADLQDPSRGAPVEDTMRTEYISSGPRASTSQTERGVLMHHRARSNVRFMGAEMESLRRRFVELLDDKTRDLANLISAEQWEYAPPSKPVCWRKDCTHRGRKQPYRIEECAGCGRRFEREKAG